MSRLFQYSVPRCTITVFMNGSSILVVDIHVQIPLQCLRLPEECIDEAKVNISLKSGWWVKGSILLFLNMNLPKFRRYRSLNSSTLSLPNMRKIVGFCDNSNAFFCNSKGLYIASHCDPRIVLYNLNYMKEWMHCIIFNKRNCGTKYFNLLIIPTFFEILVLKTYIDPIHLTSSSE